MFLLLDVAYGSSARVMCRTLFGFAGRSLLGAIAATSTLAANAAAPLTNCTGQGGVLSNSNTTCTFTVSNMSDSLSGDGSDYVAPAGSLRRAIHDANAWGNYGNVVSGNSVINIDAALAGQTITLAHALPMLMSNIAINGPSAGITIDGGSSDFASGVRCFFVSGLPLAGSGPAANPNDGMPQAIHVQLSSLTVQHCRARGGEGNGGGLGAGGALFVNQQATVDLRRVNFVSNRAIGGTGRGGTNGGGGLGGDSFGSYSGGGLGGTAGLTGGGAGGIGGPSMAGRAGGGFGTDLSASNNTSRGLGGISINQGFATAQAGGANGGGGGSGGLPGNGYGGGGTGESGGGIGGSLRGGIGGGGAQTSVAAVAGSGGFGGGGGGGQIRLAAPDPFITGGAGGFAGGGGAGSYCGCSTPGEAGVGGFGGGGGFGLSGGAGGFGAGAGTAAGSATPVARSGFGAANPTAAGGVPANGTAMGGAVFAVSGAIINFIGDGGMSGSHLSHAVPRTINPPGNNGLLLGEGMFLQGSGTITLTQGLGETLQLSDDIVDQTGSANQLADPTPQTFPTGGPFNGSDWSYNSRGSWAMVKNGPGTVALAAGNTFSGNSINNAGTLLLQNNALGFGSWTNHARMVFGTPPFGAPPLNVGLGNGVLNSSTFTQTGSGVLRMRISGPACQQDWLSVSTLVTLGGTLWVDVAGGCVPGAGQTFAMIFGFPFAGSFDRIVVTGMPAGRTLVPVLEAVQLKLQETAGSSPDLLNVDGSDVGSRYQPGTDGLLIMRYLVGMRGAALTAGALGSGASRDAAQIEAHLAGLTTLLDVDADGQTLAVTDGLMIVRRLLGLSGPALTAGARQGPASDQDVAAAIDALKP